MKKRILKIFAFVFVLCLVVAVSVIVGAFTGNPISKVLAGKTAEKHLAENYNGTDYEIDGVIYSFKHGYYHAYISSPSSPDSSFTLAISMRGKLIQDYYESRVTQRGNTADRIETDYRNAVDAVLNGPNFPYDAHIAFGDIEFVSREYKDDSSVPSYAIVTDDLILDAVYDVSELGAKSGKLTIYVYDNEVSAHRMTEILLCVRDLFDDAGVGFYAIDCVLEYPKSEDGTKKEGRVEVMDFLYSEIYEDGLTERVKVSNSAAEDYHREQDAEKLKEEIN